MYTDANGNQFHSYKEACIYYGVDTPAQVAAEEEFYASLERERLMDEMEAGVIQPGASFLPVHDLSLIDDDWPF